jgi:hypothetical protein
MILKKSIAALALSLVVTAAPAFDARARTHPTLVAPIVVDDPERPEACPGGAATFSVNSRVPESPDITAHFEPRRARDAERLDSRSATQPPRTFSDIIMADHNWASQARIWND